MRGAFYKTILAIKHYRDCKVEIKLNTHLLQVSVGTLLAFTIVAVSILILRYIPPDEVPLPSSLQETFCLSQEYDEERVSGILGDERCKTPETKDVILAESMEDPLIEKKITSKLHSHFSYNCCILFTSVIQQEIF